MIQHKMDWGPRNTGFFGTEEWEKDGSAVRPVKQAGRRAARVTKLTKFHCELEKINARGC